jgi:hypothetical protein
MHGFDHKDHKERKERAWHMLRAYVATAVIISMRRWSTAALAHEAR